MTGKHSSPPMYFGGKPVDAGLVRMVSGLLVVVLLLSFLLLIGPRLAGSDYPQQPQAVPAIEVHSAEDLLRQLKANNLWDVPQASEVPALVVKRFPRDLPSLDASNQKRAFLHVLLPAAMVALAEVEEERAVFARIMAKFPVQPRTLVFTSSSRHNFTVIGLDGNEIAFLENICGKYRSDVVSDLRRRINPVPVSLIMAQGALESSWGGSRFAIEHNNLFGVLNWDKEMPGPAGAEVARSYSGENYASLLDSVRAYLLMLNRSPAYRKLRDIREETMDSLALVQGLQKYSERGSDYIADLGLMIRSNDLQAYDRCFLAGPGDSRGKLRVASLAPLS